MCKTHQMEKKMQVRKGAEDNSKSGVSKGKEWEKTEDRRQNGKRASKKFGCNTTHSHAKKLRLSMSKALPPLCWLRKWTSETQFRLHAWPLRKLWLVYLCHHSHFPRSLRMTAEPSHRMCYLCMTNLIFNNGKVQIRGCLSGCPVVFFFPWQHFVWCNCSHSWKTKKTSIFLHNLHVQHTMTSRTEAQTKHWHEGYKWTEMWDKFCYDVELSCFLGHGEEGKGGSNKPQAPRPSLSQLEREF